MAAYLLLDKDRKAINVIEWDAISEHVMGEGVVSLVQYDGVFHSGGVFDGGKIVDPNPAPSAAQEAPQPMRGEAMSVLA
jgi:hypothetical protein